MRNDVLRALFPEMPLELQGAPYLASKEGQVRAGFGSYRKKCLTFTGGHGMFRQYFSPIQTVTWQGSFPSHRRSPGQVHERLFHLRPAVTF